MDKIRLTIILFVAILLAPHTMQAQQRYYAPLFTSLELQYGGGHWIDTPLSDLSYKGNSLSVSVEMIRAFRNESQWVQQHILRYYMGMGSIAISGAGGSDYYMGSYTFSLMHHTTIAPKLRLYYGPDLSITGGAITNAHGGNNPATAKFDLSIGFSGMAVYDFKIGKLPITARYHMLLPVIGTYNQIDWGELTYGPFDKMHLATWSNRFDMTNRVLLDLHIGTWALRLGYHNDIMTHWATDNRFQLITHNFVIGFAGDLMRWSPKNENKTIKPALYQY